MRKELFSDEIPGSSSSLLKIYFPLLFTEGVLVECEPAIKSIIVHLDSENHDFIIEDLDEQRLVVKENMVQLLKQKLEDVSKAPGLDLYPPSPCSLMYVYSA